MKARLLSIAVVLLLMFFTVQAQTSEVSSGEALALESGCMECHSMDKNVIIGPTFLDIAEKYKDDPHAVDGLFNTVKIGGKGNWTEISKGAPMPPYSGRLSDEEIVTLIDWVLRL